MVRSWEEGKSEEGMAGGGDEGVEGRGTSIEDVDASPSASCSTSKDVSRTIS